MSKSLLYGLMLMACPLLAQAQASTGLNPAYRRAQTMVNEGNAAAGRALIDSMIAVAAPGSNDYAEGVYWRAVLGPTAIEAEMDYRRIVVDFPNSPRVEDALIRLAQLEIARANYDGALRHLNRLVAEHPQSPARGRAGYWTARALFDKNDVQGGCAATADALARTSEADTELRNQIVYLNQRCANLVVAAPQPAVTSTPAPVSTPVNPPAAAPVTSAPPVSAPVTRPSRDTISTRPARTTEAPRETEPAPTDAASEDDTPARSEAPAGRRAYSVQVAAYNAKSQADAMVSKLKKSGYEARVDGTRAPYRVRIGRYSTQAQASAVQRSLKAKQIAGFVVQAETR